MDPSLHPPRDAASNVEEGKDNAAAGDGLSGLKQIVSQTLEAKGVLGTIRAQLRAAVFTALDDQEKKVGVHLENPRVAAMNNSPQGRLLNALLHEYFEFYDLDNTLSVFMPETNVSAQAYIGRAELAKRLGIESRQEAKQETPLLLELLSDRLKAAVVASDSLPIDVKEKEMGRNPVVTLSRKSLSPPPRQALVGKSTPRQSLSPPKQRSAVNEGVSENQIEALSLSDESGLASDSIDLASSHSGSISLPSQQQMNVHQQVASQEKQDLSPLTLKREETVTATKFRVDPPQPATSSSSLDLFTGDVAGTTEVSISKAVENGNAVAASTSLAAGSEPEQDKSKSSSPLTGDSEEYESDFDDGAPSIIESIAESISVEEFEEYNTQDPGKPEVQSLEINLGDLNEEVKEP